MLAWINIDAINFSNFVFQRAKRLDQGSHLLDSLGAISVTLVIEVVKMLLFPVNDLIQSSPEMFANSIRRHCQISLLSRPNY